MEYIDIHDYPMLFQKALRGLERATISDEDKALIRKYDETLELVDRVTLARRIRVMTYLTEFAKKYMKLSFKDATKEQLKEAVGKLEGRQLSVWTKAGYRHAVKKFYRWLEYGDDYLAPDKKHLYPERVSWMRGDFPRRDIPVVKPENILTEVEIVKMLDAAAASVEYEALVATLYEEGNPPMRCTACRKKIDEYSDFHEILTGKKGTIAVFCYECITHRLKKVMEVIRKVFKHTCIAR